MNDEEIRRELSELTAQPLDEHPQCFEALARHIEAELEELRRRLPVASPPRSATTTDGRSG